MTAEQIRAEIVAELSEKRRLAFSGIEPGYLIYGDRGATSRAESKTRSDRECG